MSTLNNSWKTPDLLAFQHANSTAKAALKSNPLHKIVIKKNIEEQAKKAIDPIISSSYAEFSSDKRK